jgi:hypothetical protein
VGTIAIRLHAPSTAKLARAIRRAIVAPLPRVVELRWWMRRNAAGHKRALEEARKRGASSDERARITEEWAEDYWMLRDEHEVLYTRRLTRRAARLRLPVPDKPMAGEWTNEYWERSKYTGEWYLTDSGVRVVRDAIRNDWKATNEIVLPWVKWGSGLIGAIGVLLAALVPLVQLLRQP